MSKTALIMVGLPGSGKSTLLNDSVFLMSHFDSSRTITVLSSDDYIEAKAKELGSTYSDVFTQFVKEAEQNIKVRLKEAIDQGNHIIWDQTNLRKPKRAMILNSIPNDYRKIAVEFSVPFDVILERVKIRGEQTGKHIGYNILKNMYDTREPVTEDEGFDEHIVISNGTE